MNNRIMIVCILSLCALALCGCGDRAYTSLKELPADTEEVSAGSSDVIDAGAAIAAAEPHLATVRVHVCGAVNRPGVYELPAGSRVAEALLAAGDFHRSADTDYWNQAAFLTDGEQIYVPTEDEVRNGALKSGAAALQSSADDGRIDLNTASLAQLKTLSGIGDVKAAAIIAYRESHGNFRSVEELMQVAGIKQGLYDRIKDAVCVR